MDATYIWEQEVLKEGKQPSMDYQRSVKEKFPRASIIAEVEVSQRGLMDRGMFEDLMCSLL